MQKWSDRHLDLYIRWLDLQLNEPDRADHYLMQIAAEARRIPHYLAGKDGKPGTVKNEDLRIKFEFRSTRPQHVVAADDEAWQDVEGVPKRLTVEAITRMQRDMLEVQVLGVRGTHQRLPQGRQ